MNENRDVRQINCTHCGAPLELHGGHRVLSLTCGYCGSVMDTRQEYKVLARHQEMQRPLTPFKIGMKGKIKGVEFTLIGIVQNRSQDGYGWVDYQLFSPTHGYAWLTYNRGHCVFTRRIRDMPKPTLPRRLGIRAPVYVKGRKLQTFEHYSSEITYVEGELTWVAALGEGSRVTEAIDPPYVLSYEADEQTGELEYAWGEYLDSNATYQALGVEDGSKPVGVHPAQPFNPPGWMVGLSKAGKIYAGVALILLLYSLIFGGGSRVMRESFNELQAAPVSKPFKVEEPGQLMKLDLHADLNNNWAYYDVVINRKDNEQPVYALGEEISYYHGVDGGESWSEGSQFAEALFKIEEPGEYYLEVETETQGAASRLPPLHISVYRDVMVSRYFLILFIVCLAAAALLPYKRYKFERARWGEDEDD